MSAEEEEFMVKTVGPCEGQRSKMSRQHKECQALQYTVRDGCDNFPSVYLVYQEPRVSVKGRDRICATRIV